MTEVKIYDFDFNLIASDFKCISFDWDVRFNSVGSFEGVFTQDSPVYEACSKNEFTVCVQGQNQGIVTNVKINDDRIIISGKSMNYILQKRICLPFSTEDQGEQYTETEMVCKLVEKYCGDFMEVMPPPETGEKRNFLRFKPRPLGEIVSEILWSVNCGHCVKFDTEAKKWIFTCNLPQYKNLVLSKPDNSLENCDYVRNTDDFALCGVYKQKAKFMGSWNAVANSPYLVDERPDNFAKVYRVSKTGTMFGKTFNEGNYIRCVDLSGKWIHSAGYDDFWYKVKIGGENNALIWECILDCDDIEEATEMILLKQIQENVESITRGVNQEELKPGDVVEIRLSGGYNAKVFTKQVKKVVYHYHWGNCFVKPTFYKLKENDNG